MTSKEHGQHMLCDREASDNVRMSSLWSGLLLVYVSLHEKGLFVTCLYQKILRNFPEHTTELTRTVERFAEQCASL